MCKEILGAIFDYSSDVYVCVCMCLLMNNV